MSDKNAPRALLRSFGIARISIELSTERSQCGGTDQEAAAAPTEVTRVFQTICAKGIIFLSKSNFHLHILQ